MKKIILFLMATMSFSLFALEESPIYLRHCNNTPSSTEVVSYWYQSCINNNFREIERALGNQVWLRDCRNNTRDRVDYWFTSCIERNFSEVARNIEPRIYLRYCRNNSDNQLDYFYQSCVNNNYREIERALR